MRDYQAARQMLEHDKKRWLIEEFHKALKSGCRLEERQYETAKRLEAVTGVLSVVAVRLLQLKTLARDEPQRPAKQVVPVRWIQTTPIIGTRTSPKHHPLSLKICPHYRGPHFVCRLLANRHRL